MKDLIAEIREAVEVGLDFRVGVAAGLLQAARMVLELAEAGVSLSEIARRIVERADEEFPELRRGAEAALSN